ncbi:MAG: type IV pilus modification protein PilV [Marinospirillum sp.]|uniref:type IV pilus modification protein PilV n=1 Tax=Marinospirillum sp. TaxID=2183934 RepID=UPI001A0D7663|nr:type IV pilus modification protein PilV [Marinospirillum sp.]MBE0505727.1 type IV pilus modification protein PilV [Marinospirillum sp.]
MKNLGKPKKQQGFSLIEVLVAGLVITVGLMAMVTLQVRGQNQALAAHQRSLAGLYSQDMQERLRANLCFLSVEVSDLEDPAELESFINDTGTDGLNSFLSGLHEEWRADHMTGSRSGWVSSLAADFADKDPSPADEQAGKVVEDGYWRFTLTITPTAPMKDSITQSLLINYWSGGCNE